MDVFGIVFHPDLIYGTPLADKIHEFSFFNYSETESLHLSLKEREKFMFYYNSIKEEGKEPVEILPGTVINIPANVKHWHGAAKDSWFSHLAFSVPGENESTEWLEPVDDEYYNSIY